MVGGLRRFERRCHVSEYVCGFVPRFVRGESDARDRYTGSRARISRNLCGNVSVAVPKDYPFTVCRSFGHAWFVDGTRPPHKDEVACRIVLILRCSRCGSFRSDWIGSLGQIEYRYYQMVPGYALHGWEPRDEWRQTWLEKGIDDEDRQEMGD